MDLRTAVQIVLAECDRVGQTKTASRLGVSKSTITRWRDGVVPREGQRERVISFAEQLASQPTAPVPMLAAALSESAANVKRLAQIQGYAQAVYDALMDAARRQEAVIRMLEPHVDAESTYFAQQAMVADDPETAKLRAELDAAATTPPRGVPVVAPRQRRQAR